MGQGRYFKSGEVEGEKVYYPGISWQIQGTDTLLDNGFLKILICRSLVVSE